ncbi:MAG: GNAT family N-acetyltransferase [Armatimonadetes bacterium]|nr:GNAT family N-acetyltransferase [Armatimonadota bacterium]
MNLDPFEYHAQWDTPKGPLLIRTIQPGDEQEILRLFRQRLGPRSNLYLCLHLYQTDEEALESTRRRIAAHQRRDSLVYVALQGEAIVGYFFLEGLRTPEGKPIDLGIGLADALQGCGIGGRFMDLLIEAARALGHAAIELTHYPVNTRAAALYQRKGFRYTGETVSWETPVGLRSEPRMILDLTGASPPS